MEVFENNYVNGGSKTINLAGCLAFSGLVWTVENAAKRLVWTKNFLLVFKKQETEVFRKRISVDRALYDIANTFFISSV